MISGLKLVTDFCWTLASQPREIQPSKFSLQLHNHLCVHQPGSNLQTTCSRKSCCCSSCLESIPRTSPAVDHGFDDGSEAQHQHQRSPADDLELDDPLSCGKSMKTTSRRCLSCFTSYSADCVAICCCPLAIPIFIFLTLPVLIYRRIVARFRSKSKQPDESPYQKLGIDPGELKKPRTSLLKDEDLPFIGFGEEHWKECFD